MEGEVHNLMIDLSIAMTSLLYSHVAGIFIKQGTTRFLALFPVICFFICLPLNLNTMFFCGTTSFFMSWLGSFKLILYAFGQGPLSSYRPLPLSHFISTCCLPIKILTNQENPTRKITKKSSKDYAPYKVFLFIIVIRLYGYKDYLHPLLITSLYAYYFVFMIELLLGMVAYLVRTLIRVELEPQFNDPHLATSVQDFWGKRWNLMVSSILRPTVYLPARAIFSHLVPKRWVSVPAVFMTFLVSGFMHELIFYYLGRFEPTWEVTWFFIIQGVWVGTEIVLKKTMSQSRFEPPTIVARLVAWTFVVFPSLWLFFPPFLHFDPCGKACREVMAFVGFVKDGRLLSPNEYACPFM